MTNWRTIVGMLERLRTRKGRRTEGKVFVEGYRLLERAIESDVGPAVVLISERLQEAPPARAEALLRSLEARGCPCVYAPHEALEGFIEGRTFGAMLGILDADRLPTPSLEALCAEPETARRFLVLVKVMDPGNIGALSRTAMASGMDALLAAGGTDLYHPKALRTSMGALFDLPILQLDDWQPLLAQLQRYQVQNIGAVVTAGTAPTEGDVASRSALWVGSEAHGLPTPLQPLLDRAWTIPMPDCIDSFSVNAATAVLLYEINRRTQFQHAMSR